MTIKNHHKNCKFLLISSKNIKNFWYRKKFSQNRKNFSYFKKFFPFIGNKFLIIGKVFLNLRKSFPIKN